MRLTTRMIENRVTSVRQCRAAERLDIASTEQHRLIEDWLTHLATTPSEFLDADEISAQADSILDLYRTEPRNETE